MGYGVEKLIDFILRRTEILEDELKKQSDLEDLSVKQIQCLELIFEMHNPTLSELADMLKITKPSTTAMIDKLDAKGYVLKVKSDTDRRSAHVHLTPKGTNASELHGKVHKTLSDQLVSGLTQSEKEILNVLLNKASQSLK